MERKVYFIFEQFLTQQIDFSAVIFFGGQRKVRRNPAFAAAIPVPSGSRGGVKNSLHKTEVIRPAQIFKGGG